MPTIYLFRHGQTEYNAAKMFTGQSESKLTPEGIVQAKNLGMLLKDKRITIGYTSSLARAQDTLKEVLAHHPECQKTLIDNRITERSYGILEGHYHQEAIDKYGQAQFDQWHRGWTDKVEGGESLADVEVRVSTFIADLISDNYPMNTGIAISAHGNSIRIFRKIMENTTVEECVSWQIPYDQYFEYQI